MNYIFWIRRVEFSTLDIKAWNINRNAIILNKMLHIDFIILTVWDFLAYIFILLMMWAFRISISFTLTVFLDLRFSALALILYLIILIMTFLDDFNECIRFHPSFDFRLSFSTLILKLYRNINRCILLNNLQFLAKVVRVITKIEISLGFVKLL